jgi:hypothetical protein
MNVRLIKRDKSPRKGRKEKPPVGEAQMIDTIRSWAHEFKSRRDIEASSDLRRFKDSTKS